ncbi:MAG: hypothetical protein KFF73_05915 [Cyclobacteriaceae bacterium]|nr:hypothetical protein [Cyclobacteriaceae bacterium]
MENRNTDMGIRIRNFILNELFFILLSPTLVMLCIVVYGILFDFWYKNLIDILLVSFVIYLVLLFIRLVFRTSKKIRN